MIHNDFDHKAEDDEDMFCLNVMMKKGVLSKSNGAANHCQQNR